ncbi:MAG: hypothetical protein GTO23_01100 [Nitrososphaeria archaeon]|nr:hypothetical protein [Nitrososphaeria archaeon]
METHIVLRRPRHELDLVAWKNDLLFTADCKHWSKPLYGTSLARIIQSQVERTLHLLRVRCGERAYALIITLQPWKTPFFRGVPIIPINQLNDFLLNFPGLTAKLLCIRTSTGGSPFSV